IFTKDELSSLQQFNKKKHKKYFGYNFFIFHYLAKIKSFCANVQQKKLKIFFKIEVLTYITY
nr:hypothetical protein [Acinetobacter sp.]